ncbi:MAG: hypothetical protein AAF226_13340 [Verrucomicrobiota bacterium]
MSVEEIQLEIGDMSDEDISKIIAHAVHVQRSRDPEEQALIQKRLNDSRPESWITFDEFESQLDERDN